MGTRGPQPDKYLDDIVDFLRTEKKLSFKSIGSTMGVSKERAWARFHRKKETDRVINS